MKIGILREGKNPPDKRVPFSPQQCVLLKQQYPEIELTVQPSHIRCFKDHEYEALGITIQEDLRDCDVLLGVKEVPKDELIPKKTYFFFSHTIKEQPYNRGLLIKMLELGIRMIDYETLTDISGKRLIGFGRYAGIVGAYNAFLAYGKRTGSFALKPAYLCADRAEMESELKKVVLPPIKLITTGTGRVGKGIIELINTIGIKQVPKDVFTTQNFNVPVFVNLNSLDFNCRKDGTEASLSDFYENPKAYESVFMTYAKHTDIFIAGHYYAADSPFLFTRDDAKLPEFKIRTIADVSCDIDGPVASTIRPSTIENPIYGYHPHTEKEDAFDKPDVITVMAVDNLPCELPKDASLNFGNDLFNTIIPCLLSDDPDNILPRATICQNNQLTKKYSYLKKYVS
jgi:alanine dehydrogenase